MQPGNGSSRFCLVHDVLLRQTDHDRRQDGLAGRGRRLLLRAHGPARKACAFASACFGGRAADYVWRIQCAEEGEGRDWSLVHSVGRSVGRLMGARHILPFRRRLRRRSCLSLALAATAAAAAVSRSPVEIAMILSGGIIGIHLQDERGRSE